jgi:hypothetical protein
MRSDGRMTETVDTARDESAFRGYTSEEPMADLVAVREFLPDSS